ncbi:succinate dehydrogenase, cytochrome b556 subunit [Alteromonadaceae bacterium M269]|nr:succinate dehydrogenase, cytochrome b556 subunit [Alteromonadaceae bacterium M269]
MKKQRPVNLQLNTISFPPSAIASILHRISGVGMFVAMVFIIWAWATALNSSEGFDLVREVMGGIIGKIITIGTISLLIYHVIVGIRHVIMDMGHWEELKAGNTSAIVSFILWAVSTLVVGVVLW